MSDPSQLTRNQLASIFPNNHRAVRAFEQLLKQVGVSIPENTAAIEVLIQELSIASDVANAKANSALALLSRLTDALELIYARRGAVDIDEDVFSRPQAPVSLIDGDAVVNGSLTLSKVAGSAVKVDKVDPSYTWQDMLGSIETRPAAGGGASAIPDFVLYRGMNYQYRWGTVAPNNHLHEAFINYHVPHDYVPGTDLFVHVHWSQATVDTGGPAGVPGNVVWYFDITYATAFGTPGGAADPFNAPITQTVTQQASTTQYGQMLAEVQFTNAAGDATHIANSRFAIDGIIQIRLYRDPADAGDTLNQDVFVHEMDVHYQSTNIGTKSKAPDFYS